MSTVHSYNENKTQNEKYLAGSPACLGFKMRWGYRALQTRCHLATPAEFRSANIESYFDVRISYPHIGSSRSGNSLVGFCKIHTPGSKGDALFGGRGVGKGLGGDWMGSSARWQDRAAKSGRGWNNAANFGEETH